MAEALSRDGGSTVPRRQLGRHLRQLREKAGITVRAAVETMEWSGQKLWRIEKGLGPVRAMDVKNLCELYGADQRTTEALMALAKETKAKGWWRAYGKALPPWFELYVGLEAAASRIRAYDGDVINGLVQTRRYADLLTRMHPVSEEERAQWVEVRMGRQSILSRRVPAPPKLDMILGEAALLRIPDRAVMREQLDRLLAVSELSHVSLRIIPISAGLHPGLDCGNRFTILEFSRARNGYSEPPVIYADSLTGAWYGDAPDEVAAYDRVWREVEAVSLSSEESLELITSLRKRGRR